MAPNCNTRGKIVAAEAPPYSRADTREGNTRFDVNSGGKDAADSLRVLEGPKGQSLGFSLSPVDAHRRRVFFSASLLSAKLSSPAQTLTSLFVAKTPVSAMPISRKLFADNRALGFGLRSFLNEGNMEVGIDPRDAGVGGGCGGCAVGGSGCVGLKMACKRRPREYESTTPGPCLLKPNQAPYKRLHESLLLQHRPSTFLHFWRSPRGRARIQSTHGLECHVTYGHELQQ